MKNYLNCPWYLSEQVFNPSVEEIKPYEGFVYLITNNQNGKKYIGKKSFWSRVKKKGATRRTTVESNWRSYFSSSDDLKQDVKEYGIESFKREILHICTYKRAITYYEEREQFVRNVIMDSSYYNTNIGGRHFKTENQLIYESLQNIA